MTNRTTAFKEHAIANPTDGPPPRVQPSPPPSGAKAVAKQVFQRLSQDHIQIVSAGVAFYVFLAIFPALSAAISVYGLAVEPAQAEAQIAAAARFLPDQAEELIAQVAEGIASKPTQSLGIGLAVSLLLSLWSTNKGTKALFEGLNIAYGESDDRNLFLKNGLALLFTFIALLGGIFAIALITVIPAMTGTVGLSEPIATALNWGRWPVAAAISLALLGLAYKIAPDRAGQRFRWLSRGSAIATLVWLGGSALFSLYADRFGSFNETYGSFAAVALLMLWLFLSAFSILLGAEINAATGTGARAVSRS